MVLHRYQIQGMHWLRFTRGSIPDLELLPCSGPSPTVRIGACLTDSDIQPGLLNLFAVPGPSNAASDSCPKVVLMSSIHFLLLHPFLPCECNIPYLITYSPYCFDFTYFPLYYLNHPDYIY